MDTLTHIVLGACIGEVIAGKQLGKKALFLGALAQNIPDIDCVASSWLSTVPDLLAHRGFSHSFLFVVISAVLLAYCSRKLFRSASFNLWQWVVFWGIQAFIHIFIDAFNAYGTGWFEPFSHYRVSFNTMFVADPLFTIWPLIAMLMLALVKASYTKRTFIAKVALCLSALYLLLGIVFKWSINNTVEDNLHNKGITSAHYLTTPTPLNNLLWYIVIPSGSGYYIGYRSMLDKKPDIDLHFVYRNDSLLDHPDSKDEVQQLKRFSQGYYAAQMWHDTLVFNDLRFEEQLCGLTASPRFVFHYYIHPRADNSMVVQRGRFAGWDKATVLKLIKRIKGEE